MVHTLRINVDILAQLREDDARALARALARLDDVQIASQIDNLSADEQDRVLQLLPVERRALVLGLVRAETAAEIVARVAPDDAAALLEKLESDDIVDILGELEPGQLREILARFEPDEVLTLEELLAYDEDTAGGIMSPEYVAVSDHLTVGQVLDRLRGIEDAPADLLDTYVVDEDGRLVGVVGLRELVITDPAASIRTIMDAEVVTVLADSDQEEVADIASRYDVLTVPVVDRGRRMLGVITIDDIVDVLRDEATEDILKMAGAGEEISSTQAFWASFRARLPWLAAAAVGGLLVAVSLSGFEGALAEVPVLALFMPVVAGMGGNVGTQSSTIVVRGLAIGYVEASKLTEVVMREMGLGALLGLVYGLGIALAAPYVGATVDDPVGLGGVLTLGMIGSMTIAATVGASIPMLMVRLGIDPAVSTGPFVTTAVDILGLLFYFWLSTVLLGVSA
jgi:magnesium transporter